jgi:hypothetical protein
LLLDQNNMIDINERHCVCSEQFHVTCCIQLSRSWEGSKGAGEVSCNDKNQTC